MQHHTRKEESASPEGASGQAMGVVLTSRLFLHVYLWDE